MKRPLPALVPTEKEFQASVIELARVNGFRDYHTHNSRHSAAGFPDLVLVRGDRLIFAELKTERGRVSEAQRAWLDDLTAVALACSGVEVYIWRPSHWPHIARALARRAA